MRGPYARSLELGLLVVPGEGLGRSVRRFDPPLRRPVEMMRRGLLCYDDDDREARLGCFHRCRSAHAHRSGRSSNRRRRTLYMYIIDMYIYRAKCDVMVCVRVCVRVRKRASE